MNNNILYHLADLDIRAILQEETDQLIKTVDIPKTQVIVLADNENEYLLNTVLDKEPTTIESKTQEAKSEKPYKAPQMQL